MGAVRVAGAIAAPALAVGVVGLAGPAGAASARTAQYPDGIVFHGDLTQDGIEDRFTLGDGAPCGVNLEPGLPGGGFGPAVAHDYYVPPYAPGSTYCPDLAAVVDLGGDGVNELLLAWFNGDQGVPYIGDLIVLRDYVKVASYEAVNQPSAIKTTDLNLDGLVDVYEDYGNSEPFISLLNTPSGELVPGPLRTTCGEATNTLADYDEDGRPDLLVAYLMPCVWPDGPSQGAMVVLDDGTQVPIFDERQEGFADAYADRPVDANGDGHLDVVAKEWFSGQVVAVFLGDGHGGFAAK